MFFSGRYKSLLASSCSQYPSLSGHSSSSLSVLPFGGIGLSAWDTVWFMIVPIDALCTEAVNETG